jgi:transcriptional regulator with XRE-family HTH domain
MSRGLTTPAFTDSSEGRLLERLVRRRPEIAIPAREAITPEIDLMLKDSPSPAMTALLGVVSRMIQDQRMSARAVERQLGWGHGTLSNILRGRSELRIHHVEILAGLFNRRPIDLFLEAYGPPQASISDLTVDQLATLVQDAVTLAMEKSLESDALAEVSSSRICGTLSLRGRSGARQ